MGNVNEHMLALPPGYRLQEYEILRVLGVGGFGITYLCFDHNLDQARAIKEYLPNEWATRLPDNTVGWKSTESKEDFEAGLKSFLDEARRLARFKHDNIVKVHRSFSTLGTAYIVMEYAEGETLSSVLDEKGTLTESELKAILLPIVDGLEEVHKVLIHRDIKPGNIIIRDADDSPVLLDFGSARQAAGSKSKSMTAIVTAGFAPIEQYSTQGNQGPWTDIYALGCLCYRALSGETPREAPLRLRNDPTPPIRMLCKGKADDSFLAAIDWAMRVYEEDRPQQIGAWRAALVGGAAIASAPQPAPVQAARTDSAVPAAKRSLLVPILLASTAAVGAAAVIVAAMMNGPVAPPGPEQGTDEPADAPVVPQTTDLIANATPAPDLLVPGLNFRDRLRNGDLGPMMVTVPAGSFEMGNRRGNGDADEEPAHTVEISVPFALGKYEITFEDYDRFVAATGAARPGDEGWGRDRQPAVNISWNDAQAYARWLSGETGAVYRLPSEAEWEYAGRAGSTSSYAWGGSVGEGMANCRGCTTQNPNAPAVVGSFPVNAFGLHDLQGNVWEWVEDCARDSYLGAPSNGDVWQGNSTCSRVLRGGSWASSPNLVRSSYRNWYPSDDRDNTTGFRLVREIDP